MDDNTPNNVVTVNFGKPAKSVSPVDEQKRTIFADFLEAGIVAVAFDTRDPHCQVPSRFRGERHLVLNFAYAYRVADFGFDDEGIFGTLTFPEGYFFCFVPWGSVLSMHSDALQKSAIWTLPEKDEPKPKNHLSLVKD